MKSAIVVGGGIGGLAVAALLAKQGIKVTLLEKNASLGGRARTYKEDEYVFDMGPSWYMMPDVFETFFSLFGKKTEDYYDLVRLPIHYKVLYDNGNTYSISSNMNEVRAQFERAEKGSGAQLDAYLAKSKHLYETAMSHLVLLDYKSMLPLLAPRILFQLPLRDLWKTFHSDVASRFKNPELQKIIEFTTVFLGGSPYNTPAFYELISHTDFHQGIWYPMGGIHQVVKALETLCKEMKVEFVLSCEVDKIEVEDGLVKRVVSKNRKFTADVVVCNADYAHVETTLLDKKWQTHPRHYWDARTLSPSGLIIYLGLDKKYTQLDHHNLYFNSSWEKGFETVYKKAAWPDNPSYYVHVPSHTDSSVAPSGHETMMILVPVAAGLDDSDSSRELCAHNVIKHLERLVGEEIVPHIKTKRIYSHRDFIGDYNSFKGSAFGIAHTLLQTAIFRPKNFSRKVKNLYYAGQYTNPGVGMPVCLLSAQIVANLINKDG